MTQVELAARLGVPLQRVNTIIAGRRAVTAETALLLAKVLKTTPEFWLNAERRGSLGRSTEAQGRQLSGPFSG
jgi:addiction module HigA family antidote